VQPTEEFVLLPSPHIHSPKQALLLVWCHGMTFWLTDYLLLRFLVDSYTESHHRPRRRESGLQELSMTSALPQSNTEEQENETRQATFTPFTFIPSFQTPHHRRCPPRFVLQHSSSWFRPIRTSEKQYLTLCEQQIKCQPAWLRGKWLLY